MKATIKIPKDKLDRHHVTIPIEIWEHLKLKQGEVIEVEILKIKES
jgi:bifunctional DNA-binding transcriptional regulator/antitoxin component of YhaV-PrlF toxin-antitoxin module